MNTTIVNPVNPFIGYIPTTQNSVYVELWAGDSLVLFMQAITQTFPGQRILLLVRREAQCWATACKLLCANVVASMANAKSIPCDVLVIYELDNFLAGSARNECLRLIAETPRVVALCNRENDRELLTRVLKNVSRR